MSIQELIEKWPPIMHEFIEESPYENRYFFSGYIDTGITFDVNKDEIECCFVVPVDDKKDVSDSWFKPYCETMLFGMLQVPILNEGEVEDTSNPNFWADNNRKRYDDFAIYGASSFYGNPATVRYAKNTAGKQVLLENGSTYTVRMGKNGVFINGELICEPIELNIRPFKLVLGGVYIRWNSILNGLNRTTQHKYVKVWQNDMLVREFIPYENALYDKLNNTIYDEVTPVSEQSGHKYHKALCFNKNELTVYPAFDSSNILYKIQNKLWQTQQ